ncbi:MAG: sigma-70 family RNA polymerase sigma factor [Planctomycetota bacterium]
MSEPKLTVDDLLAHSGWLRALARRLVGEAGADDLVQEVWLRATRRPPAHAESPKGWLRAVLRSVHARQVERSVARSDREQAVAATEPLPSGVELLEKAEAQRSLVEAVMGLSEPCRTALLLHYFEGLSAAEIARRSGEPSSTVRNRVSRGVQELRERLDARPGGRASWVRGMALLVAPEAGVAGVTTLGIGSLVMWKYLAVAASVALIAWLGSALLLGDPEANPAAREALVARAGAADVEADTARSQGALDALAAGPARAAQESDGDGANAAESLRLIGVVVDTDGRPVAGASVRAGDVEPAVTGADGRFELPAPAAGRVTAALEWTAPGYVLGEDTRTLRRTEASLDAGTLVLDRAAELAGNVLDAAGLPVNGAELRLEDLGGATFETRSIAASGAPLAVSAGAGSFTLAKVPVGPWRLRADHPDHPTTFVDGETVRPGAQPESVEVRMTVAAALSGLVVGGPVDGEAAVLAERVDGAGEANASRAAALRPDGSFEVRGLVAGDPYDVVLRGGEAASGDALTRPVRIVAGEGPVELELLGNARTPAAGSAGLRFRVVDASSGAPLDRFRVFYRDGAQGPLRPMADGALDWPGGFVELDGLSARSGELGGAVRVEAEGSMFFEVGGVAVSPGSWTELGDLSIEPAPGLRVRVVDSVTSMPIAGAEIALTASPERTLSPPAVRAAECVRCHGGPSGDRTPESNPVVPGVCYPLYQQKVYRQYEWGASTGPDGAALVDVNTAAPANVAVRHPDYVDVALERARYAFDEVLEIRMDRGGRVVATVIDASGAPVAGASVTCDGDRSLTTDADGRAVFEGVAAGNRVFAPSREARQPQMVVIGAATPPPAAAGERVRVRVGEEVAVTLELASQGAVTGVVTERGEPLAGARVLLEPARPSGAQVLSFGASGPSDASVRTRSDGSYRIEGVDPGAYRLVVSHRSRAMKESMPLRVDGAETRADVALSLAVLEGVVLDSEGAPVAGARVTVRDPASASAGGSATMFSVQTVGANGAVSSTSTNRRAPSVKTDEEGRFVLRGVADGVDLELSAAGAGGSSARLSVDALAPNELRSGVQVIAEARGTLRFQVSLVGGLTEAFPSAALQRLEEGVPVGAERIVSGGPAVAVIDDIVPGTYAVCGILQGGERTDLETIVIEAGRTVTKNFRR